MHVALPSPSRNGAGGLASICVCSSSEVRVSEGAAGLVRLTYPLNRSPKSHMYIHASFGWFFRRRPESSSLIGRPANVALCGPRSSTHRPKDNSTAVVYDDARSKTNAACNFITKAMRPSAFVHRKAPSLERREQERGPPEPFPHLQYSRSSHPTICGHGLAAQRYSLVNSFALARAFQLPVHGRHAAYLFWKANEEQSPRKHCRQTTRALDTQNGSALRGASREQFRRADLRSNCAPSFARPSRNIPGDAV